MKTFVEYMQDKQESKPELWSATKKEIVGWWNELKPNQPIMAQPIPQGKEGSTYGWDGVRITGSKEFISSVMSRFKDFVYQENPSTKLRLAFRQVEDKHTQGREERFVFYANTVQRSPKKPRQKKLTF